MTQMYLHRRFLKTLAYVLTVMLVIFSVNLTVFAGSGNSKSKLNSPTNLRWLENETMTLSWNPVDHADYYYFWCTADNGKYYFDSSTTSGDTTQFNIADLVNGMENRFEVNLDGKLITVEVTAMTLDNSENGYLYYNSDPAKITKTYHRSSEKGKLATPSVSWVDEDNMILSWNPVDHADYYYFWCTADNGKYYFDSSTTSGDTTQFNIADLVNGMENRFGVNLDGKLITVEVTAMTLDNSENGYLYYNSDPAKITKTYHRSSEKGKLATPSVSWVDEDNMILSWNPVDHADYYYFWCTADNGKYYFDSSTTSGDTTQFNIADLVNGMENRFGVNLDGELITVEVTAMTLDNSENGYLYYNSDPAKTYIEKRGSGESGTFRNLQWQNVNGKSYWYENNIRQGTYSDNKCFSYDGTLRGREIYDPDSDGWYWLDVNADGAKAVGKEVFMPYVYQDEKNWSASEIKENAKASSASADRNYEHAELAEQVQKAIENGTGKWVRYDSNGMMLKGWVEIEGELAVLYPNQKGNVYYYDRKTGLMAKGWTVIGGTRYHFDEVTGVLK